MLTDYVASQLEELQPDVFFQQDGAPPYWGVDVCRFLDETFPNRWIGRDGPIPWPPRSPDITPLDYFFWGFVKEKVFNTRVCGLDELKVRINDTVLMIDPENLKNTFGNFATRLDKFKSSDGGHIEVL